MAPMTAERIEQSNYFATCAQETALQTAITAGPAALLSYARTLNARYQARAEEQVDGYRLLFDPGCRYASGVINPERIPYRQMQDEHGETVCMCAMQSYIERVNEALRGAGFAYRVVDKHRWLLHYLERRRFAAAA